MMESVTLVTKPLVMMKEKLKVLMQLCTTKFDENSMGAATDKVVHGLLELIQHQSSLSYLA